MNKWKFGSYIKYANVHSRLVKMKQFLLTISDRTRITRLLTAEGINVDDISYSESFRRTS